MGRIPDYKPVMTQTEAQAFIDAHGRELNSRRYKGVLLLFRIGDVYYPVSDDRERIVELTGLAEIPYASAESEVGKIIEAGQKVGIVEPLASLRIEEL